MTGSIIKISEAASIGLHAMIIIAQNPKKPVCVKEISDILDASANHLSKIMQRLGKAGFIKSIKGYHGGFKLIKPVEKISFLEIYELFDGKFPNSNCLLTAHKCKGRCILGDLVTSVNRQVKEKFEKTKLSDFVK